MGVTAKTIKVGISLVDFTCIQQFVNQIRVNQNQGYDDFIKYVNDHGGVAGRKVVPDYQYFCPIQNAQALALCTKFTEDDHVFAVMGNFVDFSGDAQTCLAKDHNTVLITFQLSQAIMSQSPPGLIILPGPTPERVDTVVLNLMQKQHTLKGQEDRRPRRAHQSERRQRQRRARTEASRRPHGARRSSMSPALTPRRPRHSWTASSSAGSPRT